MPLTPHLGHLRRFVLVRRHDGSGVSGTGVVAAGAQLIGGWCVFRWVDTPASSVAIFETPDDILTVHGHGGATELHWIDPPPTNGDLPP